MPDFDINFDQAKDVLRLFSQAKLKPSATRIFVQTMMEAFGKEIPVPAATEGEISDWIISIRAMTPAETTADFKKEVISNLEKFLDQTSNANELLSAVYALYPGEQWKEGVSLSKVTRYLMERAGIQLPVEVPPAPHHLRAVQVSARCFEILKNSPFDLIERSGQGDRGAVLNLVKIDKLFLHDRCTRNVLTDAERCQDNAFLKKLAGAVRYKPRGGPRVALRCLLYIFFVFEIELPQYSKFQALLDPDGSIFRGIYAFEKFVERCQAEFNSLK